jgi:uncharacterized membrane protein YgcG
MDSKTIKTQIVVQFDDQFTEAAIRSVEKYKKSLEEAQATKKEARGHLNTFFENLENEVLDVGVIQGLGAAGSTITLFKEFPAAATIASLALANFYTSWKAGQFLEEWLVGDKPVGEYVGDVKKSVDEIADLGMTSLPPISIEILYPVQELEEKRRLIEQTFDGLDIFVTLQLIDQATEDAVKIRKELEAIYKTPITQIINIKKISSGGSSRSSDSSSSGDSGGDSSDSSSGSGDSGGDFDGSSVNPGGFDTFASFSTGIDRVPRDMLAMIHKDETVLTKTEAEERRSGNSGGMAIQRVSINMNMPDSFNPSNMKRQDFRQFAMKMQDELRRLDRRMSR